MSVDKFGGSNVGESRRTVITPSQISNTFLRRDGGNSATADIRLDSHKLVDVSNPTNAQDAATKSYVDEKAVAKNGDTITGDLRLSAAFADRVRLLGCTDLPAGKGFTIAMGNLQNQLNLSVPQAPVNLDTEHGFQIRSGGQVVCRFDDQIRVNGHHITNLPEPQDDHEPATKSYVDRSVKTCDIYTCGVFVVEVGGEQWHSVNITCARRPTITRFDEERLGVAILHSGIYRFSVTGYAFSNILIGVFSDATDRSTARQVYKFFSHSVVMCVAGSTMFSLKIMNRPNDDSALRLRDVTLVIEEL